MIQDDVVHEDFENMANIFNDKFADILKNSAELIGRNNNNYLNYLAHVN